MRRGKYAHYNGKDYEVKAQWNGIVTLHSHSVESLLDGFHRIKQFISDDFFMKEVPMDDIDHLYEIETHAKYEDTVFAVYYNEHTEEFRLETDDSLSAHIYQFQKLGPDLYTKSVQRHEIELIEEAIVLM
ncbi:hypothetical protein [Kurthia senegalensis]|uniref:hypothetical protein n=1 Tax=Kurthia senegalensis TaxID=1033740 RepID=UPI00028A3ECD|nr:hypothetical protein [Kurthia senegalensis]